MTRKVPILPTLLVAAAVATMIALGVWQLQRLKWKEGLIARVAEHMQRPVAPLGMVLSESMPEDDPLEWRRVSVRGHFIHEGEIFLYARGPHGETGVQVVTDLHLESLTEGPPAATYIDLMKHNVTEIVKALK